MRRLLTAIVCGVMLTGGAAFAGNPAGTGQPNQSCEEQPSAPSGFSSGGFANAEDHYAGNGDGSLNAASGNAVSQYDVACYQVSQH